MQLQLQTFTTLVNNAAAAVQGAASQLLDLTVGSVLRAVLEANAAMALWLQWLLMQVLRTTRAATSEGGDLDSWVADFGLVRLPAVASNGLLTFARFTPTAAALIPVGATARTADGSQTFSVIADPTNAAWSAAQNGFVVAAGAASINAAALATTPGAASNVQPGTVTLLGTAIPGIDTVTNAAAFQGGVNGETDAALRARFAVFLPSLVRATRLAVTAAIANVQQGLLVNIAENQTPDLATRMGFFTVTLDDGSGHPPAALITSVSAAIEAVRPLGTEFTVQAPTIMPVTITLTATVAAIASHATVAANVTAALTSFIDGFPLGAALTWSRITQVAYSADANVINVTNVLLNGATADLTPAPNVVLKVGTITVN